MIVRMNTLDKDERRLIDLSSVSFFDIGRFEGLNVASGKIGPDLMWAGVFLFS